MYKEYNFDQWTPEWYEVRKGTITGTKLDWVLAWPKAQLTAIYELIADEFFLDTPTPETEAMRRGKELEAIARAKYEIATGQKVREVWFLKSDDFEDINGKYVWLSPDWLIGESKAIEIKCIGGKNFVKFKIENKIPDEYLEQVQMYFIVIGTLEELDFVIFNPDCLFEDKQLFVINTKRADHDLQPLRDKIVAFRKLWIENIHNFLK